jgi:hypothetical protein
MKIRSLSIVKPVPNHLHARHILKAISKLFMKIFDNLQVPNHLHARHLLSVISKQFMKIFDNLQLL